MNPTGSKSRSWKLALLLGLPLLAAMLGVWSWVAALRDRRWSAMHARVEVLSAEPAPAIPAHLSLGRELLPGNAWDDYLLANPQIPGRPPERIVPVIIPFLARTRGASRVEVDSLLSRFSGSIDLLSRGARRLEARPPPTPNHDSGNLSALGLTRARLLAEAGKIPDAIDLLSDVCVHAWDIAQTPELSSAGKTLLRLTFREIRDLLQSREVAKEDLLTLERRLEMLDVHFPGFGRDLEDDLLKLGKLLIREDRDDRIHLSFAGRSRRSWRYFYSSRLQAATTFLMADTVVRRVQDARALPWQEQREVLQQVRRDVQEAKDPLIGYYLGRAQDSGDHFQTLAALRLLRLAAHYRATGEILKLADPLGGMLETAESEGILIAWHRTHFGSGAWTPKKEDRDYTTTTFIEVRKP